VLQDPRLQKGEGGAVCEVQCHERSAGYKPGEGRKEEKKKRRRYFFYQERRTDQGVTNARRLVRGKKDPIVGKRGKDLATEGGRESSDSARRVTFHFLA